LGSLRGIVIGIRVYEEPPAAEPLSLTSLEGQGVRVEGGREEEGGQKVDREEGREGGRREKRNQGRREEGREGLGEGRRGGRREGKEGRKEGAPGQKNRGKLDSPPRTLSPLYIAP
jgi:hypothetical protein